MVSLNVLYFYVRRLILKLITLGFYSPDVICVVESWLDADIGDSEISIQGYSVIRLDRSRHGGGVLIFNFMLIVCFLTRFCSKVPLILSVLFCPFFVLYTIGIALISP